jgi:hypothetical protein
MMSLYSKSEYAESDSEPVEPLGCTFTCVNTCGAICADNCAGTAV